MIFVVDQAGKEWFIGGLNGGHGEGIVAALNAVLELLASRDETDG